jgi:hypothetical protein
MTAFTPAFNKVTILNPGNAIVMPNTPAVLLQG